MEVIVDVVENLGGTAYIYGKTVSGEDIVVHRVPRGEIADFVEAQRKRGLGIDVKLLLLLGPSLLGPALLG